MKSVLHDNKNKEDPIVVYIDGSFIRNDEIKHYGLGVLLIDSNLNSVKIGTGFILGKENPNHNSSTKAELFALENFVDYVYKNNLEHKKFIIYGDSEPIIKAVNLIKGLEFISSNKNKSEIDFSFQIGITKDTRNKVSKLNVEAFWVKGHAKEPGNLLVDALAYNALLLSKELNQSVSYEFSNLPISKLTHGLLKKRVPDSLSKMKTNEFEKLAYERHLEIDKNFKSKEDDISIIQNSLVNIDENGNISITVYEMENGDFKLNDEENSFNYEKAIHKINSFVTIMKENNFYRDKKFSVIIKSKKFLDKFDKIKDKYLYHKNRTKIVFENKEQATILRKHPDFVQKMKEYKDFLASHLEHVTTSNFVNKLNPEKNHNVSFIIDIDSPKNERKIKPKFGKKSMIDIDIQNENDDIVSEQFNEINNHSFNFIFNKISYKIRGLLLHKNDSLDDENNDFDHKDINNLSRNLYNDFIDHLSLKYRYKKDELTKYERNKELTKFLDENDKSKNMKFMYDFLVEILADKLSKMESLNKLNKNQRPEFAQISNRFLSSNNNFKHIIGLMLISMDENFENIFKQKFQQIKWKKGISFDNPLIMKKTFNNIHLNKFKVKKKKDDQNNKKDKNKLFKLELKLDSD